MRICYDPEVDAVYARVAEPTGPARTEVLESGVAVERSAEADGGAYGFEFVMVKSRGLPTIDLPSDVALAIEEFVTSGALESRDKQQQITPTRLLLSPPNQQDDRRSLGPQQPLRGRSISSQSGSSTECIRARPSLALDPRACVAVDQSAKDSQSPRLSGRRAYVLTGLRLSRMSC
jgi:hypothetical protein